MGDTKISVQAVCAFTYLRDLENMIDDTEFEEELRARLVVFCDQLRERFPDKLDTVEFSGLIVGNQSEKI